MAVASLGAGSGVLTSTIIDQLKAADSSAIITPITNKITLEQKRSSGLSLLNSLLTTFKASVSALDDDSLYQKRSISGTTSSVTVTADTGVAVQSFSIANTTLATNNIKESGGFISSSSTVATGTGTMKLTIGGATYNIDYTSSTTIDSLKESINNTLGTSVKASILQVGSNDYRLVLNSGQTGADQAITISDSTGGALNNELLTYDAITNKTGIQDIQVSKDASFKYNGITMTRSSNIITDITPGMTINLLQDNGSANIVIAQDTTSISDSMSLFVSNYNALTAQLTSMTTSDITAGTVGIFNGDNSINSITREINQLVTSISSSGYSLPQFGIDLNETGTMSFNSSTFLKKFNTDPSASEAFFSGKTTIDVNENGSFIDGLFTSMNTLMDRYTNSSIGIMNALTTSSTANIKALNDNKTRSQALLDARYNTMTARFVQYDTIMTKLTNQFASLKSQINAYSSGN